MGKFCSHERHECNGFLGLHLHEPDLFPRSVERPGCGSNPFTARSEDDDVPLEYPPKDHAPDGTKRARNWSRLKMPEKETMERAHEDAREGKSPSTQAGEFVREEIHHVREGKHGARNTQQAIAIGLSKARRAGVDLPPNPTGKTTEPSNRKPSAKRSRATSGVLNREGRSAASTESLSRHATQSSAARGPRGRQEAAAEAVRTKGAAGRKQAAKKAARTRSAGQS